MSDGIAIAEILLNHGANIQPEKQLDPPFAAACEYATAAMVEFLASRGANVNPLDKHGIHPLTLACYNHFAGEEIIHILIHAGSEPLPTVLNAAFNNGKAYMRAISAYILPRINSQLRSKVFLSRSHWINARRNQIWLSTRSIPFWHTLCC